MQFSPTYYSLLRKHVEGYTCGVFTPLELARLCIDVELSLGRAEQLRKWLLFALRMASRSVHASAAKRVE